MLVCENMSTPRLLVFLLAGLLIAPMVSATEGRAAPQCAEFDLSDVVTSSSGVAVEPGACLIVDIGIRSHTTTLAIDYEVLDDAMDVLMFDQSAIQTYNNGQNYRSAFNAEASFESMIGSEWLDWAPPTYLSAKNWYVVFDNSKHDGDEGLGDQGGMTSRFKIQLAPAATEDYTLIHDTFVLQPGERMNLATFNVDTGTELTYWVHPISGSGDVFIQSDNQLDGDLIIADSNIEDFGGQDTTQLDWTVPEFLNLQNLNLMAEAGTSPLHFSIKAWFDPVLAPQIEDYSNSTTTIGEEIILDASSTPDSLQQIRSLSWDFDSDGTIDATGTLVQATWDSPGMKTVNLTAESESGETTVTSHQIEVLDVESPVAVITGMGGVIDLNGDRRILRLSDLVLQASNSYDDHAIASASWSVNGEQQSSASQFTVSWSDIGTYVVTLTVSDPSGNIGTVNATIRVYDSTEPILVTSDISEITEVEQGEEIELKAKAADEWDAQEDLRFTWDLDLSRDSNGDGDATNDPDYTGATLAVSFDDIGEARIAVTVYDQSNNSDFEIFEIQVVEPPSEVGLFAIIAIVFLLVIVVCGVVLFGYKGIQRRAAVELLMQNGLSLQEATNRVADITRNTNLPAFATATQMAGITEGGVVKSSTQLQSEAKAEEFDAIYGNDPQIDPHAGFRPSTTVRQVDPALAEAALAAFAEDAQPKTVTSSAPVSGKVKSGGVALPQSIKPVSHKLKSDCTSCGKAFTVEMPPSINSAVVACPSCGSDQLFER
tara:strand:+ start:3163 stop:5472 length:2310 start_codon:yes stop_codon:yes gene_type:complete